MSIRPRCVLVLPVMPSPHGSGLQQRAFHLLALLAKRYDTAVLVAGDGVDVSQSAGVELPAVSVTVIPAFTRRTLGRRLARWLPPLVLLRPSWSSDWPDLDATVTVPFAQAAPIALCVVFRLRMHSVAAMLHATVKPQTIALDLDDIESSTLASIGWFALRRGRLRLALNSFSKALQSFWLQRVLLRTYDEVYVANPEDMAALQPLCGDADLIHLPNRPPLSSPTQPALSRSAIPTLLFLGTLSYFPNEDAALWLVNDILPALRRRIATPFRIRIAGRGASPRLRRAMQNTAELEFFGEVPTVENLYAEAHLALVVVRCGGGTKIKALEAAAFHCPSVGTAHSMRGLGFEPGRDYLHADTADQIAACCATLLAEPELAGAVARAAYQRLTTASSVASETAASNSLPL